MKYYAVRKGRKVGIYNTWEECKKQVHGYVGASYKSFKSMEEALTFIQNDTPTYKTKVRKTLNPTRLNKIIQDRIDNLEDLEAIAFVDGSYRSEEDLACGNVIKAAIGFGAVILTKNNKHTISKASFDEVLLPLRNVSAEIKATIEVINWSIKEKIKKLDIYYDYMGIEKWALKEWKANNEVTKSYAEFFASIKDQIIINFHKVESHTGVIYNEEADELAAKAISID